MGKHDFELVTRRNTSVVGSNNTQSKSDSEINVVKFPNGSKFQLSANDISAMVNLFGDATRAVMDIKIQTEATNNQIRLIREEIDSRCKETEIRMNENEQEHKHWMEKQTQKVNFIQNCLQWLEENPGRSATDLAIVLEANKNG
jgi:hypothetical protein